MNAFTTTAEFYEVLSDSSARLEREAPLLLECFRQAPGRAVVDLACGTGLHALLFAGQGAHVSACDISPDMIAHARKIRPHPNIHYAAGDMRDPIGGPWDMAVCLGNSLSLVASEDDVRKTMDSVFSVLSPAGLFVVQILNFRLPANQQPRHRVERRATTEGEIVAIKDLVPEAGRTLLALTFFSIQASRYFAVSDAAILMNLSLEQLTKAARHAGFAIEQTYGAFDRSPYNPDASPDLILMLRKPV